MSRQMIKNKKTVNKLLRLIELETDDRQVVLLAQICARIMSYAHTGVMSCFDLEESGLRIAKKYSVPLPLTYKKKSFLHVLTRSYISGGHTKVVNNWINNASSDEVHSVILLDQHGWPLPPWLKEAVFSKKGEFINLNISNEIERALKLRQIGAEYEYIVLHIHPYDFVPLIAFGTDDFKRPVIFFNHADHLFWVGISITDIVSDFREVGKEITLRRRGCIKSSILPIPIEPLKPFEKFSSRELLGIANDKKIIISVGSAYKYLPVGKYNFISDALDYIKNNEETIIYVIGPSLKNKLWARANKDSCNRLIPIGIKSKDEVARYISAADLYLESFPMPSFTAILEAASSGLPVKPNIDSPIGHCDVFTDLNRRQGHDGNGSQNTPLMLNDSEKMLKEKVIAQHCPPGWHNYLNELLDKSPRTHSVQKRPAVIYDDPCYDEFLCEVQSCAALRREAIDFDALRFLSKRNLISVTNLYLNFCFFQLAIFVAFSIKNIFFKTLKKVLMKCFKLI